jgi:tetratricopeptide (TPR) repeat protein
MERLGKPSQFEIVIPNLNKITYFFLEFCRKNIVRNQNFIFVTFCLVLTLGMLQFRHVLNETYGEERALRSQLSETEVLVEKEKMKAIVYQNQLIDMQSQVASLELPDKVQGKEWIQALRVPASVDKLELSSVAFAEGTKAFNGENYANSSKLFRELIEKYPASAKVIEARFLLVESYFRLNRLSECLDQIDEMINHYPDNKLTGYVMLRMGQIFGSKNQPEKMGEVYRMVIKNFSHEKALVAQAEELLNKAEK